MHDLFALVTSSLGIPNADTDRNISAFELPSLLDLNYYALGERYLWDHRNSHPHFRCQDPERNAPADADNRRDPYRKELRLCFRAWLEVMEGRKGLWHGDHPCQNGTIRNRCCQLAGHLNEARL